MIESDFQEVPSTTSADFPWPPPENGSVLEAAVTTWKESLFHPTSFFRRMPREFDFAWVIGYYIVIGVIAGGVGLFWEMLFGEMDLFKRFMGGSEAIGSPVIEFLLSPLLLFVALWVMSGVVHLFLLLFRAGKNEFTTTTRVFCYSIGPALFEIVPFIGGPVGGIWSLVITIIGLREAHQTTTGRVVASVLVPIFLLVLLLGLLFFAGMLLGVSAVT